MFDLSRINLIKESYIPSLLDPEYLEKILIPHLGLSREALYPESLKNSCSQGLYCAQYPNQLNKYLIFLAKYKIETYLEIGLERGGTFITTLEYLSRINSPVKFALGIDIIEKPVLFNEYFKINKNAYYLKLSSQSAEFREILEAKPAFDLVLIDGDHSYQACMKDFETVKEFTSIIVFHDIVCSYYCPQVARVWQEIKENPEYHYKYNFYEITDQYQETMERHAGNTLGGFGIMVKRDFEKSKY